MKWKMRNILGEPEMALSFKPPKILGGGSDRFLLEEGSYRYVVTVARIFSDMKSEERAWF